MSATSLPSVDVRSAIGQQTLGVWVSPGLGNAYPELVNQLDTLYRTKVQALGFVPSNWYQQVHALQELDRTSLIRPSPSKNNAGTNLTNVPEWISSNQQVRDAWQAIVDQSNQIIGSYAKGQAEAGKAELDRLTADAAFWNSPLMTAAINTQQFLRAVPEAVSTATGTFVSDLFGGFLKKAWWVVGLVVVGYIVWANRDSFAKSAGTNAKKAAKAVAAKVAA